MSYYRLANASIELLLTGSTGRLSAPLKRRRPLC
jgi:hypothetical protein